ncbi:MAG: LPS assembly protein LptD [Phycisphaerae bacterium]
MAPGQIEGPDEPILPESVSRQDVEMRGRYARQWKLEDGTLVVMFTGGFQLDMGERRLTSKDAVVWIRVRRDEQDIKYYDLEAYLSQSAVVREAAGTITEDSVLLVSNLRTRGKVVKFHDAHSPESMEQSMLYQQALADKARIEEGRALAGVSKPTDVVSPTGIALPRPKPPRVIRYRLPNVEPAETSVGEQVFVSTGRVYFSQSGDADSPVLEIQADNAVVFPSATAAGALLGAVGEERRPAAETQPAERPLPGAEPEKLAQPAPPEDLAPAADAAGPGIQGIRGVYLEGDVVLTLGERFVRANRLYYDFERSRALILDAVFRTDVPQRGIPLYVRAEEIRQLSAREFLADEAMVSTSEFYTPSYHVGAEKIYIRDRTPRDTKGQASGALAGTYEMHKMTLNVGGVPIAYWPYSKGDLEQSETLIRRLRTGFSDDFGVEVETAWELFNLLGLERPPGHDARLRLDYFSKRGPAVGIDDDYKRDDQFGHFRSYYIHDTGKDNLGPLRDNTPEDANRGRVLWRHRHFLPNDWEATLELSYIGDPNFLEEYERAEFNEGKEQETLVYLKRARGVEAISLLANWRILDFVTQTEHLPDLNYRRIGDLVGPLVLYHESRVGSVRYRPDDRRFFDSHRLDNTGETDVTFRADGRQEAEWPIKLPGGNLAPFATVRGSYWSSQPLDSGGLWRGIGVYGVRGAATMARVYDEMQSELLDVDRVRHIVKPEFVAWWAHSNTRSELITPFDTGVETIDPFYGGSLALRQTWQTKRGNGDGRRTVDLLTFDVEAGFFGGPGLRRDEHSVGYVNPLRPEDSRSRNYVAADLSYRLSDSTSFLYDVNYDLNDGRTDRHDISLAVERSPRLSYIFGHRYIGDIDTNLVGGGYNYKLSEKHITAARIWWDIDRGDLGEAAFSYIYKLPRWYFALNFEYDNVDENFSVSMSLWPEGIPEWTLGSRRFSRLSTSTGIRP